MSDRLTGTDRDRINALLESGAAAQALRELTLAWADKPSPSQARFLLSRLPLLADVLPRKPCRVAFLRSFTVEPVVPLLQAASALHGIDVQPWIGEFNAYPQEILDPGSGLYGFGPDVVVLAVLSRDVTPDLWCRFADLSEAEIADEIARVADDFDNLIANFRANSDANLIVHGLEPPPHAAAGVFDGQDGAGQLRAFAEINREISETCRRQRGVFRLDYAGLMARHGSMSWFDQRMWSFSRLPISATCLIHMAEEWLRFIIPLAHRTAKVLVVDLDDTLWGGVIGEVGMSGIEIGDDHPGVGFKDLQRAILDLHKRGILLAICSKNNPDDALEALKSHPEMVLRPDHFAAQRIDWEPKPDNIRAIAAELNLGLDSVVFLDDNPAERAAVALALPEVRIIDLPDDPVDYGASLRRAPHFETLAVTAEDRLRGTYYTGERARRDLRERVSSPEAFLRTLGIAVAIEPVETLTIPRAAQLTQKTNQFNLTTRRYSEEEIGGLAARPDWGVYVARARDRFGDNGIVGIGILRHRDEVCEIDTFALSCRVIGRAIETALLSRLCDAAREAGAQLLTGWFLPTAKNAPAADFYRKHDFRCREENGSGSRWDFDLAAGRIEPPDWITIG